VRAAVLWIAEVQCIRSEVAGATRGAAAGETNPPAAANPGLAETLAGCGGAAAGGRTAIGVWGEVLEHGTPSVARRRRDANRDAATASWMAAAERRPETPGASERVSGDTERGTRRAHATIWGQLLVGLKRKKWAKSRIVPAHQLLD